MEASARMDELRAKLAKPKPATPDKWEPDDHPHAIWCSYYGPDDAMQSTNTLSYIAPAAQENRFDLTLAGAEATSCGTKACFHSRPVSQLAVGQAAAQGLGIHPDAQGGRCPHPGARGRRSAFACTSTLAAPCLVSLPRLR